MATKEKAKKPTAKKNTKKISTKVKTENQPLPGAFEIFKPSMNAFVLNIGVFLALYFFPVLVVFGGGLLAGILGLIAISMASYELVYVSVALFVVILLLAGIFGMVLLSAVPYVQIRSVRNETVSLGEAIRAGKHFFWRMIGLGISVGFVVFVGLLCFIVPGIIFIRRYFLAFYFLADQDTKIFEAMRLSSTATKDKSGAIWGVIGVNFLLGLVGILPYIGWLISSVLQALYFCAPALRYDQLKQRAAGAAK